MAFLDLWLAGCDAHRPGIAFPGKFSPGVAREGKAAPEAAIDFHQPVFSGGCVITVFDHCRAFEADAGKQGFGFAALFFVLIERNCRADRRDAAFGGPFVDAAMLETERCDAVLHVKHLAQANTGAIALGEWPHGERVIARKCGDQRSGIFGIFGFHECDAVFVKPWQDGGRIGPFENKRIGKLRRFDGKIIAGNRLPAFGYVNAQSFGAAQGCRLVEHNVERRAARRQNFAAFDDGRHIGKCDQVIF